MGTDGIGGNNHASYLSTLDIQRVTVTLKQSAYTEGLTPSLPIGVRPRQLPVRTLLLGMLLVAAACRPAHLRRVHQTLLALPEAQQRRLGIIAPWRDGPHLLTYRQVERTFALVVSKLANDTPDGTPSQTLTETLDALLEASITVLGPFLSTSGETLTIEESMTLRARTENAGHAGDEHERSWSSSSG